MQEREKWGRQKERGGDAKGRWNGGEMRVGGKGRSREREKKRENEHMWKSLGFGSGCSRSSRCVFTQRSAGREL